ncbi:hypothetical protein QUW64_10025 [Mediterranea massiliensis]|nr:hypothetical protein [Mediterranea massiliensis]
METKVSSGRNKSFFGLKLLFLSSGNGQCSTGQMSTAGTWGNGLGRGWQGGFVWTWRVVGSFLSVSAESGRHVQRLPGWVPVVGRKERIFLFDK